MTYRVTRLRPQKAYQDLLAAGEMKEERLFLRKLRFKLLQKSSLTEVRAKLYFLISLVKQEQKPSISKSKSV